MTEKFFVLSAKKYEIADKDTGVLRSGVTMHYVPHLNPTINGNTKGVVPIKGSLPLSEFDKLISVPGEYQFECVLTADYLGNPKIEFVSVVKDK